MFDKAGIALQKFKSTVSQRLNQAAKVGAFGPGVQMFANRNTPFVKKAAEGFAEASTFGLYDMPAPKSQTGMEKLGYVAGSAAGFFNPLNPVNKLGVFSKIGQLGAVPTKALVAKVAPKATGFIAKKIIPAIGSEVAQTAAYGGAKVALGQKFDPVTDLAMGIAGRGVFGKFQPDLPSINLSTKTIASRMDAGDEKIIKDFLDYTFDRAGGKRVKVNPKIEIAARKVAEAMGINPDVPNRKLGEILGPILEDYSKQAARFRIPGMGLVDTKGVQPTVTKPTQLKVKQTSPGMALVGQVLQGKTPKSLVQEATLKQSKVPGAEALPDIVTRDAIDVKSKVGILDYLRTPERVLKKIGLENESNLLRAQYDKYLKELPQEIGKITEWSKQVPAESSQRIFKFLDGQEVVLTPQETKVAGEIKTYLKEWADRLGLPEDKRITNYITHIFEKDFIKKEFDPEIAKLIEKRVPGSVYDPFTEQRLGKMGYVEDVWRALDAYVKRATRKVNMDVALKQLKEKSKNLELSQFNYVKQYADRINLRPTQIDNLVDNSIKQMVGYKFGQRPTNFLTRLGRQAVYRGALGLNFGTALRNLTQGANTYAKLGEKYTVKGYWDLLTNGTDELRRVGVLADDLIQDRQLNVKRQLLQKIDKGLFYFFETAEKINRGSAYYGAKAKALAQGMSEEEAIEYGKKIVRDTQFRFGAIDAPMAMQSDIAKLLTQFQSFSLKQAEFLGEMAKNKEYAGLIRYGLANMVLIATVGQLIGMEWKDMIPSFRIGLPPTLQTPVEIGKAVLGVPDKYGNVPDTKERLTKVGESLVPFVPGGVQAKKTVQGLTDVLRGYSAGPSGQIKYPVEQSPENYLRGGLFGRYNLQEAKEYRKEKRSILSKNQTERVIKSGDMVSEYEKILQERELSKKINEIRDQVRSSGEPVEFNGKLYYKRGDRVYSKDLSISTNTTKSKSTTKTAKLKVSKPKKLTLKTAPKLKATKIKMSKIKTPKLSLGKSSYRRPKIAKLKVKKVKLKKYA